MYIARHEKYFRNAATLALTWEVGGILGGPRHLKKSKFEI